MICVSLCFDPSTSTVDGPLRPVGPLSAMAVRQLTQVLGQELERQAQVEDALRAFEHRRWERCRMVVHNSRRLGEIELAGGPKDEHAAIVEASLRALAEPI